MEFEFKKQRPELLKQTVPGDHVWVTTVAYAVSARALLSGETIHLDTENIALASSGCFICEKPFSSYVYFRKCTGEPK